MADKTPLKTLAQAFRSTGEFDKITQERSAWMIHFTSAEDAEKISREGFQQGTPLHGPLAHCFGADAEEPGVNFAFLTKDEFSILTLSEYDFGFDIESAVVFRASGVRMHHYDGFFQCAFWGPDAAGPFHLLHALPSDNPNAEAHTLTWKRADTGQEGDLFDLISEIESAPVPRRGRGMRK